MVFNDYKHNRSTSSFTIMNSGSTSNHQSLFTNTYERGEKEGGQDTPLKYFYEVWTWYSYYNENQIDLNC
jgi:hypothetical protein